MFANISATLSPANKRGMIDAAIIILFVCITSFHFGIGLFGRSPIPSMDGCFSGLAVEPVYCNVFRIRRILLPSGTDMDYYYCSRFEKGGQYDKI